MFDGNPRLPPGAARLMRLAGYLDDLDPARFSLSWWVIRQPHCGTVCCAVGHAAMLPEFRAQGLNFGGFCSLEPTYDGLTSWSAVQAFFEITAAEANRLFSLYEYPDGARTPPRMVAARIRELVTEAAHV